MILFKFWFNCYKFYNTSCERVTFPHIEDWACYQALSNTEEAIKRLARHFSILSSRGELECHVIHVGVIWESESPPLLSLLYHLPPHLRLRLPRKLHARVSYRLHNTIFLLFPPIKQNDECPGKKVTKNLLPGIEYQAGFCRLARHQSH